MTPSLMIAIVRWFATYPTVIAAFNGDGNGPAALPDIVTGPDPRAFFESKEEEISLPFLALGDLQPAPRRGKDENMAWYQGDFAFVAGAESALHAWFIAEAVRKMMDAGGVPWPESNDPDSPPLVGFWISQAAGVSWSEPNGCWVAEGRIGFETQGQRP